MTRIMALALLVGCGGGKDVDTAADDGCPNNILAAWPDDGAANAYYRTRVDYHFAVPDGSAALSVTGADGAEVPGTWASEGSYSHWRADSALTGGASYTATLDWQCGEDVRSFTVGSDLGVATDVAALGARAWRLDLRAARGVHPLGIDEVLGELIQFDLLVGISASDGTTLDWMAAVADDSGAQDVCTPSIGIPSSGLDGNPDLSIASELLPIEVGGSTLEIDDMVLSGTFSADGSLLEGVTIGGNVDTRPLAGVLTEEDDGDPNAVCELFGNNFNIDCEDCPDGSGKFCIALILDTISAPETGFPLAVITDGDVSGNPDCASE
ncbi:MAG: hypothetical protein ACI8PZ_000607 [Myxococcota bacterium]|jgi:hypothetical protein